MRDASEPRGVRLLALGSALALASFGAVGLLLADLGIYRPQAVLVIGLAGFVALYLCARPLLHIDEALADGGNGNTEPGRSVRVCGRWAVALCAVSALWNARNASQHVQINSEGGLYLNAGQWIATHGTLNLHPLEGPFAHNPALAATSRGLTQRGDHLEFDVSHMLSAVLAEAHDLGGKHLMFAAVPILSGFALLAFYFLALRLLQQPIAALGATATLALLMPQVSFSRDSMTEIPIQLLLFTALWILCDRRTLRAPRIAFVAGLLLGLVQAMHVDGLAFIIGLPAVYAVTWLHTNRAGREGLKRGILWSAVGAGVGLLLGAVDLGLWDRDYLSVVQNDVVSLVAVEILMIGAAIGVVLLVRHTGFFRAVQRSRASAAYVAGALVVVGGFGAWFVRPHIQHVHAAPNEVVGFVQRINGLPIDSTQRYAELSVRWISWYAGPITLTLAIIGAAGLAIALFRGSLRLPIQTATFMFAPPALLYIWRPAITPDQVWAARRFLPAVFPVVILLAWAVICVVANGPDPKATSLRRSVAIVLGIATVAFPWMTIREVSQMTEQHGLFPVITTACKIIGHDSAVVMLRDQTPKSAAYLSDPQSLRSFCNVPVAVIRGRAHASALQTLAGQWRAEGRRLFVVAEYPQAIKQVFPSVKVSGTGRRVGSHVLELTLTRRPNRYAPDPLQIAVAHQLSAALVPLPVGGGKASG